jgi:hypothetical protein
MRRFVSATFARSAAWLASISDACLLRRLAALSAAAPGFGA